MVSEIKNSFNMLTSMLDTEESVNLKTEITSIEHKEKEMALFLILHRFVYHLVLSCGFSSRNYGDTFCNTEF